MLSTISLLLFFGLIFWAINFLLNKIQTKIFIPTGVEYIILGVVVNPAFANWINTIFGINYPLVFSNQIQTELDIILELILGLTGFVYGLNFQFSSIKSCSKDSFTYVFFEIFMSFLIIGGLSYSLLFSIYFDGYNFNQILTTAYLLFLTGALSSKFIIKKIAEKNFLKGANVSHIKQSTFLNINFILGLYGVVYGIAQISNVNFKSIITYQWVLIGIALILALGILFYLFIGKGKDELLLFIATAGIISLTSGVSISLNFSVLYMNFLLGVIIINTSKVGITLRQALARLVHPLAILLIFFAGYKWMPTDTLTFTVIVFSFLLLRFIIKIAAGKIFTLLSNNSLSYDQRIGKASMPIEIIAAAIVLDYSYNFYGKVTPILMSAVFSAIIFWGIFGYNSVKKYLIDLSELKEEKL